MRFRKSYLLMAASLVFGCAFTVGANLLWSYSGPKALTVKSISVEPGVGGSHLLVVDNDLSTDDNCARTTNHMLYRWTGPGIADLVPLGDTAGGLGLDLIDRRVVVLDIPAAIPKGRWFYKGRSVYFCQVVPGIIRMVVTVSDPHQIDID